jgi:hypothetical protein
MTDVSAVARGEDGCVRNSNRLQMRQEGMKRRAFAKA